MEGIYRIRNKLNDKRYIGSTNNFEKGWAVRSRLLERDRHHNPHLQHAWNKYGKENFVFEIEEEVLGSGKALLEAEQVYLDDGFALGILYNVARKAGGGNLGEVVNRKISKALIGMKHTEEARARMGKSRIGVRRTDETRARISKSHIGLKHSKETKAKMRASKLGKNNPRGMLGKTHTDETKIRMSRVRIGKKHTEEAKMKIGRAHAGKEVTEETRARLSKASAKPYPAFFNTKIKEYIPAGRNLKGMCSEQGLSYDVMLRLKTNPTKISCNGWRLASTSEMQE